MQAFHGTLKLSTCLILPIRSWSFRVKTAKWCKFIKIFYNFNFFSHFLKILEKLHWEQYIQITRQILANTGRNVGNVNLVTAAHFTMEILKRENLLTHFQIYQKVLLFLQCQKKQNFSAIKSKTIITAALKIIQTTTITLKTTLANSKTWCS